jgi:hypothetical protein
MWFERRDEVSFEAGVSRSSVETVDGEVFSVLAAWREAVWVMRSDVLA